MLATKRKGFENENTSYGIKPAADWNEALPIGNGRLGGMILVL